MSDAGGEPEPLTRVDPDAGELQHRWPDVLPDATAVLFTVRTRTDYRIDVLSLKTGERHVVHPAASDGRFSSSGHLIFFRSGSLFAIPFDPVRLETSGADVPFLEDVQVMGPVSINYGLSRNGTLVYTNRKYLPNEIVWVARDGTSAPVVGGHSFANPRLSPDGDRLAVSIVGPSSSDVWTYDLRLGAMNRFTFEQANHPMWSPDGSWIVFSSQRDGAWGIYRKKADGTGGAEKLVSIDSGWMTATFFASNGTALGFTRYYTPMTDTLIVDLAEDAVPQPLLDEESPEIHASLSPDERYLAYSSYESGRSEIFVRPYPSLDGKWQISTEGGVYSTWSADGRELFYRRGTVMIAVDFDPDARPPHGDSQILFEGGFEVTRNRNYDVAPDGRFLMVRATGERRPPEIHVVLNWFEELKRLAPTE